MAKEVVNYNRTKTTQDEVALFLGISQQAVSAAVRDGRIKKGPGQGLFLAPAVNDYWASKLAEVGDSAEMAAEKLRQIRIKNEDADLNLARKKGDLVSKAEYVAFITELVAVLRSHLTPLASKAAGVFAGLKTAADLEVFLDAEIAKALNELADQAVEPVPDEMAEDADEAKPE